jgi:DNA-binding CsgD family transcriptional regulator
MVAEQLLSPREKRFLRRIAAGKTDREIARRLGGTAKQVSEQRARLLDKIRVGTAAEIADAAKRLANLETYKGVT